MSASAGLRRSASFSTLWSSISSVSRTVRVANDLVHLAWWSCEYAHVNPRSVSKEACAGARRRHRHGDRLVMKERREREWWNALAMHAGKVGGLSASSGRDRGGSGQTSLTNVDMRSGGPRKPWAPGLAKNDIV